MSITPRHIALEGAKNFRDFGGYTTRCGKRIKSGLLFRADSLANLTDNDLMTLAPLNIQTICDLRRARERTRSPSRWHQQHSATFHALPFFLDEASTGTGQILERAKAHNSAEASRQIMIELYQHMVMEKQALSQIQRLFEMAARPNDTPMLIHCSGGKDRTGIACALLQLALGVDKTEVMADYMHSLELYSKHIDQNRQSHAQIYDSSQSGKLDSAALRPIYLVDPDYLNSSLDSITTRYGDMPSFLSKALKFDAPQLNQLRAQLLE